MQLQLPTLTRQEKRKLAQAAGAVAVISVGAWWFGRPKKRPKKIDYGVRVNALCSEFTITDQNKLERTFDEQFERFMENGVADPWVITSGFISKIAPQCRRASREDDPIRMRNPGEALLYFNTFVDVAFSLQNANLLSENGRIAAITRVKAWAIDQGVAPDNETINKPALYAPEGAPQEPTCPAGTTLQMMEQNGEMVPVCV